MDIDKPGIYRIINKINDKKYFGQAICLINRIRKYPSGASNVHLKRAIEKYGWENFELTPLFNCDEEDLDYYETSLIAIYDTTNPEKGYNKTSGGEGGKKSKDACKRMSESQKGKTGEKNNFYGRKHTEESRQKMKIKRGQRIISDYTRRKNSESQKIAWIKRKQKLSSTTNINKNETNFKGE